MYSNQNSTNTLNRIVNRNKKIISYENLNYLYPDGHRMTHQMIWFKGSRDRGLRTDMAA